jgi:hypothetical protein
MPSSVAYSEESATQTQNRPRADIIATDRRQTAAEIKRREGQSLLYATILPLPVHDLIVRVGLADLVK